MAIKPINDTILVQPINKTNNKKGALYIPDRAKEDPQEGMVIEVGDGKYINNPIDPLSVKKGDCVIFKKSMGSVIKNSDQDYIIIREKYVLAIISYILVWRT